MTGIRCSKKADRKKFTAVPLKKTLVIFILVSCSLTLSGCVYLRLLEVKKQFKQFDKYVMAEKEDGLTLSFLRPILYQDDIKWLGFIPVSQEIESGTIVWRHILEKVYNNNQSEQGNYDLVFATRYQNKKLHASYLPERYFTAVPKDFIIFLFQYMGNSDMDLDVTNNTVRYTGGDVGNKHALSSVKQNNILKMTGIPYLVESRSGTHSLEYRYRVNKSSLSIDTEKKTNAEYVLTFTFSQQDFLITFSVKFPVLGTIELDFRE